MRLIPEKVRPSLIRAGVAAHPSRSGMRLRQFCLDFGRRPGQGGRPESPRWEAHEGARDGANRLRQDGHGAINTFDGTAPLAHRQRRIAPSQRTRTQRSDLAYTRALGRVDSRVHDAESPPRHLLALWSHRVGTRTYAQVLRRTSSLPPLRSTSR